MSESSLPEAPVSCADHDELDADNAGHRNEERRDARCGGSRGQPEPDKDRDHQTRLRARPSADGARVTEAIARAEEARAAIVSMPITIAANAIVAISVKSGS